MKDPRNPQISRLKLSSIRAMLFLLTDEDLAELRKEITELLTRRNPKDERNTSTEEV